MIEKKNDYSQAKSEGQVIQRFPYRYPYCDHTVSYDQFDLKVGENEIQCPSCQKTYIKIVSNALEKTSLCFFPSQLFQ